MSNEIEFAPHEVEAKTCTKVNRAEQRVAERVYLCAHAAATSAKIKEGYEKLSERKVAQ